MEFRPRVHHRNADQPIFLHDVLLGEAGGLEHDRGGVVEHLEIARVIDHVRRAAVAQLDLHIAAVNEHAWSLAYCRGSRTEASRCTTSPNKYGLSIMCSASEA